ncbi:hypothetical protein PLICRDRAFT_245593 [Plicaturopsis crispa FD-325 SS-3]|nr:hypothetical protein PLICRDRAFT_245593 [Plicaturopsis crispa FD-325 SS-3]
MDLIGASPYARANRLPPELTDMIIAYTDFATSIACALVCRSWTPASRLHIGCGIDFRTPKTRERTEQLCSLLESPHSTLANCDTCGLGDVSDSDAALAIRTLSRLRESCVVEVRGEWGTAATQRLADSPVAFGPKHLAVRGTENLESGTDLLNLLNAFPSQREMCIDYVICIQPPQKPYPPCRLSELTSLWIYQPGPGVVEFLLPWLEQAADLSRLRSVTLGRTRLESWDVPNQFFKRLGKSLLEVTVCAHDSDWPEHDDFSPGTLDLSHNPALESVVLRLDVSTKCRDIYYGDPAGKLRRICLPRVVSMLSAPGLAKIAIEIDDATRDEDDEEPLCHTCVYDLLVTNGVDWAALDNVLADRCFDTLREVVISYNQRGESVERVEAAIRQRMPLATARGVLVFHCDVRVVVT